MSRNKGNQKTKFGQLIECNMKNIFDKASYTKCGEESIPRPFKIDHISRSMHFMEFAFIVCQVEGYRNIMKPICRPLAFTSY